MVHASGVPSFLALLWKDFIRTINMYCIIVFVTLFKNNYLLHDWFSFMCVPFADQLLKLLPEGNKLTKYSAHRYYCLDQNWTKNPILVSIDSSVSEQGKLWSTTIGLHFRSLINLLTCCSTYTISVEILNSLYDKSQRICFLLLYS